MSSIPDWELPQPPADSVTAVALSATGLLASSWDSHVHHYGLDIASGSESGKQLQTFQHEAPVLDVCFVAPNLAASACLDRRVRLLDLETGQICILGSHGDAVSKICWCSQTRLLISASWDRTLKIWSIDEAQKQGKLLKTIDLPDKVLAAAISPAFGANVASNTLVHSASAPGKPVPIDATPRLVIGMVGRQVYVYDLIPLRSAIDRESAGEKVSGRDFEPDQKRESSLKYMIRDLQCMPAGDGYATSSIEGRIAVEFFDPSSAAQQKKYAFKCHRQPAAAPAQDNCDTVYPVNAVAFHPIHATFASMGGDAVVSVWDAGAKKRVKQYAKLDSAITAGAIDPTGQFMVVAIGGPSAEYTETEPDSAPPVQNASSGPHAVKLIVKSGIWSECKPKLKSDR